ncbi:MAG: insulinase family protein, partial [Bacteroidota bacterium]|nr:insulinase family protein [Bacteroidota bacterium]MDX5430690.1 insulinase family protein [Bacteroidota bacterium]MDX5469437.1 insulinase family protein [Bacteroidota bacterium]
KYQDILNAYKSVKKEELVAFANEWYGDTYITVFKREGIDTTIAKITKPQIRPIELNKGKESTWLKEHAYQKVEPVRPQFLNFETDLQRTKTESGMEVFYVQNKENDLFSLYYVLEMGSYHDLKTAFAIDLLPYLGTTTYSPEELNKKFYELAADFGVVSSTDRIYVYLDGLQKNFDASLELFEHLLRNAKPDQDALDALVARTLKSREDAKKSKRSILFGAMLNYAMYGEDNPYTYRLKKEELLQLKAEELTELIKGLLDYQHLAFYYGPESLKGVSDILQTKHQVPAVAKPYPTKKTFTFQNAPKKDVVYFVDFDMVQAEVIWLKNSGAYDENMVPVATLFNEYFDGGMGTIVFQELRESKALAYSTYANFQLASDPTKPNYVMAYIGTQSDKLMDAVPAMVNLFNTPPSDELAVRKARSSIKQQIETRRVIEEDIFFSYLQAQRMGRTYDINEKVYQQLDELGMPEITQFQEQYFNEQAFYYCVLGSEKKINKKDLKKIGKVKILKLEDIFGKE